MSKYLVDKFLYTIDRDPDLVERYRDDPRGTVDWWEAERANLILNFPASAPPGWRLPRPSARPSAGTTTSRCSSSVRTPSCC